MTLRIASKFTLPIEYQTHSAAILAQRRKGKTYLASVIAEEMAKQGLPFVVLDPTGAWWGLRSSADGRKAGYPVVIIGGEHGDLPLAPDAGKVIADLVVDRPGFYVIDLSLTESQAEQDRFVTAFNKRLYRRKAKLNARDPLHIFIDEADEFAPQRADKGQGHLLSSTETLVRRGGLRGIGVTLISQRPAVIHKNVLTQVDVMFILRMTGKQDIDAIDSWVRDNATPEQRQEFKARITKLPLGTAWAWSPGWLECFKEIEVRERRTFNSSATPQVGVKPVSPTKLAPVDVAAISAEIEATIERAKENDPTRLRQEIAQLRRRLAQPTTTPEPKIERVETSVLKDEHAEQLRSSVATLAATVDHAEALFARAFEPIVAVGKEIVQALDNGRVVPPVRRVAPPVRRGSPTPAEQRPRAVEPSGDMTGPEQRILDAIAWMESIGIDEPNQVAVAFLAGYKYGAGGYNNPRSKLKGKGVVEYRPGNRIVLTDSGRAIANSPGAPLSVEDLHERVLAKLPNPEQRLLRPLLQAYPDMISNEDLAQRANYVPGTGGYNNPRGRLRGLGLVSYPESGYVVAEPLLFLERVS